MYNKRCNLEPHLLPTHIVIDFMDLITQQVFSQGKVDCINKSAWEIIKRISSSLEVIDDDSNNDLFYTPPSNPLELIFIELENCLSVFIMVGGIHVFFYIIIWRFFTEFCILNHFGCIIHQGVCTLHWPYIEVTLTKQIVFPRYKK